MIARALQGNANNHIAPGQSPYLTIGAKKQEGFVVGRRNQDDGVADKWTLKGWRTGSEREPIAEEGTPEEEHNRACADRKGSPAKAEVCGNTGRIADAEEPAKGTR